MLTNNHMDNSQLHQKYYKTFCLWSIVGDLILSSNCHMFCQTNMLLHQQLQAT